MHGPRRVAPGRIGRVYGIFKAYCTRVGSGPFPTELLDDTGAEMRRIGHEYGAVTGRERRCGWLDLVALRYAAMVDGATDLIMMKSDVLDGFDTIKVCTAYRLPDGTVTRDFPLQHRRQRRGPRPDRTRLRGSLPAGAQALRHPRLRRPPLRHSAATSSSSSARRAFRSHCLRRPRPHRNHRAISSTSIRH